MKAIKSVIAMHSRQNFLHCRERLTMHTLQDISHYACALTVVPTWAKSFCTSTVNISVTINWPPLHITPTLSIQEKHSKII